MYKKPEIAEKNIFCNLRFFLFIFPFTDRGKSGKIYIGF